MKCTINWNTYTRTKWECLLNKCQHVTLLQSYYYAQSMREIHQQNVRHGLIQIDGVDAGIVQMHEVSLFKKLVHVISIDRGPLWFDGFGKFEHINAFSIALNEQYPPRFGRKRRFIPEFISKNSVKTIEKWMKCKKTNDYQTIMLDISKNSDEIRKNLKQTWRRNLNKAEKEPVKVETDEKLSTLGGFLQFYTQDRMQKGYSGPSAKFLASLAKYSTLTNDCMILNAVEDGEIIGSILILTHGSGATYQVGWTTPYGRDKRAHHLLFWHGIQLLKQRGITSFDLGGYNDEIDGIRQFKQGMGGQDIALIGSYN
jgi:hypothetical protein